MRRVPRSVSHLDKRDFVRTSLETGSKKEAIKKSVIVNEFIEEYWKDLIQYGKDQIGESFELIVKRAKLYNLTYKTAIEISKASLPEIVERLSLADTVSDNEYDIEAIIGGKEPPSISLETLWHEYFEFIKPNLRSKSKDQFRKWKNPRLKAFKNFEQVCGTIPANEITREHILTFRAWWSDRLHDMEMSPNSPNKDLSHLKSLLAFGQDNKNFDLDVEQLFARLRFQENDSKRKPFSKCFIKDTLLDWDKLEGLNDECKYFLFAFADTGARPSELVGLNAKAGDIRLDTKIPYIYIRSEKNREIKNRYSKRKIPLVGASLFAFKNLPNGFEQYFQKPDSLSANLNKFLRKNNLLPTENHTAYSLRHSFEDRLTEVEPPDKVQAALMGHKYDRPRYGDGPSLEQKYKWLKKIAFTI